MAYSYETSSVKTINGEVSGLADVVARQAIANLPTLSGGEGVQIVNEDGKNRIDLGLSAGSNMSFVYDQETNTIRLDAEGGTGGIDWTTGADLSAIVQTSSNSEMGFINMFGMFPSAGRGLVVSSHKAAGYNHYWTVIDDRGFKNKHIEGSDTNYYFANSYLDNYGITLSAGSHNPTRKESNTYNFNHQGLSYNSIVSATWGPTTSNTTTWTWSDIDYLKSNSASLGKTYSGVAPIVVNNTTNQISADTWSFSAGNGLVFTDDNANKVTKLEVEGETLSAGPGINIFSSGGYVVISANGGGTTYTGDAQGALDEVYANSGVWLTSHQSLSNYVSKSDNSVAIGFQNNASYSFAQGEYCRAANYSFAQGTNNSADNDSFAQGYNNIATSYYTFAQGNENRATGMFSFAQGKNNTAALQSFAQGFSNSAYDTSLAQGANNRAYNGSIAQGRNNYASNESQAFGNNTKATNNGMAIGTYNKTESAAFVVGNGTSNNKSDAFIVFHDGSVSAAGKISANGVELGAGGGSTFPITGTNGTTGFTANMDCSSMMLTTGASPAGGYVKQTVRGVQYEAYPATDVSASWYNIINATNNRSNCYCIRFTNDMTAASLEDYSAYDKVTVVHSNQYTPNCELYWDGKTKTFPSGLYCELVKGTNDQNQTDWFFTTSGWINNVEWDWD